MEAWKCFWFRIPNRFRLYFIKLCNCVILVCVGALFSIWSQIKWIYVYIFLNIKHRFVWLNRHCKLGVLNKIDDLHKYCEFYCLIIDQKKKQVVENINWLKDDEWVFASKWEFTTILVPNSLNRGRNLMLIEKQTSTKLHFNHSERLDNHAYDFNGTSNLFCSIYCRIYQKKTFFIISELLSTHHHDNCFLFSVMKLIVSFYLFDELNHTQINTRSFTS